jgi:hypothetical protein
MSGQTQPDPLIVVAGESDPAWFRAVESALDDQYRIARYTARGGYISRLADDHPAMILVNGADAGWSFWVTAAKTSPATRRIPVLVVTDDAIVSDGALLAGADVVYHPHHVLTDLPRVAAELARVVDSDAVAQLAHECDQPLPDLARQGVEQFNAGEYYQQHDLFEALWVQTATPVRDLYRAVLQVGVAYYQITRGNGRGARKMLLRSLQWLHILPDRCQGIDVKALREDAARVRAELERLGDDADLTGFDRSLLRPVRWTPADLES